MKRDPKLLEQAFAAERALRQQYERRNAAMRAAHAAGHSFGEIAKAVGMSRARVHQIVSAE